ncbi:MAG TPA: arginine N-succinyltransferase [Nitrosomonas sp.]|nr:arginine N-succinyltransferase [Nitrosomonas sp.]HMW69869.1 arginine N-succinyltransferase [Nitrosomonas sp.]HMY61871.1 arginine N-succinyltransferase [Nitrosomonas sp.]HMY90046.1 arginine N-succinyltransferase [Nitrosomonas sp.]HNA71371.1 arginine N-succinyltransferase [Nitrosomonas sp.]
MNWSQIFMIVLLTMLITIGGTYWVLKNYVFTTRFTPVELNEKEEKSLHEKLLSIGFLDENTDRPDSTNDQEIDHEGFLKPEAYSEHNAPREIIFTERELNALLAKNTDLAQKLAIDLANNLVSAKLLIPLEEDFPILGGKTLRVNAGIGMAYQDDKPYIALKGISIMGVPIPNAWLGGIKNVDLVNEFGIDPGFWKSFSEGVENIQVTDGKIFIKLKE